MGLHLHPSISSHSVHRSNCSYSLGQTLLTIIFRRPTYVPTVTSFFETYKTLWDIKLILFFIFHVFFFFRLNFSTPNTSFLVYWQPHTKFSNHQTGVSITVSSKMLVLKYIWSLSSIHQDKINHTASLPVRTGPNVRVLQSGNIEVLHQDFSMRQTSLIHQHCHY